MYFIYILRCRDDSLYCGMTLNLERRIKEHNSSGARGAKYLRAKKPVVLVYAELHPNIKTAMNRELQIKKWPKLKKEALVKGGLKLIYSKDNE
ncbi:MAG: GIY-YIG nuclease family protein [Candidatus Curtissbacteria bacterium]